MTAFWETWAAAIAKHWGSWGVEIFGGLLLATVVQFAVDGILHQTLVCLLASVFYESVLDPNGWEWADVLQRAFGIAGGLLLWLVLR